MRANGHDESFLDLLTNWAAATLLSDNTGAPAPYRYNTGDWRTSHAGGVEYRLGSINLYNYIYRAARPPVPAGPVPAPAARRSTSACSRRIPTCTPRWAA